MKKFMSLLLVGIMMLSLVACGKSGGGKGELLSLIHISEPTRRS